MERDGKGEHAPGSARGEIYRHLHRARDFCGKQDLARALGLSMPTVYRNVRELMDMGLVGYSGEQRATGGRSASGLAIVPEARLAVGVSVTDDRLRFALTDLRLRQLAYKAVPFAPDAGFEELLARELERFLDENGADRTRLLGVGVAIPGILSAGGRRLLFAPTLDVRDVRLDGLYDSIRYPLHVDNDANCGGSAEWFIRDHQPNMAYLSLEGGVGGAILIDNALYTGQTRRSGEFGHMCVEPGGLKCSCGRSGCLEAYCSVRRIHDEGYSLPEFFSRIQASDPVCGAVWGDMLRHLAIGVNNIHMALDCDVVLGGYLAGYLESWFPLLQRFVADGNILGGGASFLQLSHLGSHSSVLGAACHFVQEFISSV